jgi:hypothetical protein
LFAAWLHDALGVGGGQAGESDAEHHRCSCRQSNKKMAHLILEMWRFRQSLSRSSSTRQASCQIPRLGLDVNVGGARSLSALSLRDGDLKHGTGARGWRGGSLASSEAMRLRRLR